MKWVVSASLTWPFLLTSLAIIATPGTGVVLTVSAGLRGGRRLATVTAFGCTLGIVPHLVAAITGTAAFLRLGGLAFDVLRFAGVLYLLFMAWLTWCDTGNLALKSELAAARPGRTVVNAVVANLLNPKLTLFFFAFLPQFVEVGGGAVIAMLTLSGIFMGLTFLVFFVYGAFASAARRLVVDRPVVVRRIQRAFSLSYIALGAKLAATNR